MSRRRPLFLLALPVSAASVAAPPAVGIPSAQDAPIALLVDVSSGQTLFAREPDRRFMPASITKAMTTFVAFQRMAEGKLFQRQMTAMRPETFKLWHGVGSTMFLGLNEPVSFDDLVHGVTTVSANDGAVVLAEGALGSVPAWVAEMNRTARALGMRDSHFGTPNGWMDDGGTWVTARDLVTLGSAMVMRYPAYYRHYVGAQTFRFNEIEQHNHDPISGVLPGADGIKTGFTNQAGYGFLGSAQRNGRRLMMVIATAPTGRARNNSARSLMEWGFQAFDSKPILAANTSLGEARVQGGAARWVDLVPMAPVRVARPLGSDPRLSLKISYDGPLQAPVKQGEPVARLQIFLDGAQVSSLPLVAAQSVAKANFVERIRNGVMRLLPWG